MRSSQGFSLIESLIAILVFSFGLLSIAGVLGVSVKNNYNGYLRSQAAFQASSILDSMRRNIKGVWMGEYNSSVSGYSDISSLCSSSGCNASTLADRDLKFWGNSLNQTLPNSEASVECTPDSAMLDAGADLNQPFYAVEPFSGVCVITINWTESNEKSGADLQTFVLRGKP